MKTFMRYAAHLMLAISFENTNGYVARMPIERCEKQLMFSDDKYHRIGSFLLFIKPIVE